MTLLPIHPLRAYVCTLAPAFKPCGALAGDHLPLTERRAYEVKAISMDGAVFAAEKATGHLAVGCKALGHRGASA